jgi:hypothetical protein
MTNSSINHCVAGIDVASWQAIIEIKCFSVFLIAAAQEKKKLAAR